MNMGFGLIIGIMSVHGIRVLDFVTAPSSMNQISPQFQEEYMDIGF